MRRRLKAVAEASRWVSMTGGVGGRRWRRRRKQIDAADIGDLEGQLAIRHTTHVRNTADGIIQKVTANGSLPRYA